MTSISSCQEFLSRPGKAAARLKDFSNLCFYFIALTRQCAADTLNIRHMNVIEKLYNKLQAYFNQHQQNSHTF